MHAVGADGGKVGGVSNREKVGGKTEGQDTKKRQGPNPTESGEQPFDRNLEAETSGPFARRSERGGTRMGNGGRIGSALRGDQRANVPLDSETKGLNTRGGRLEKGHQRHRGESPLKHSKKKKQQKNPRDSVPSTN